MLYTSKATLQQIWDFFFFFFACEKRYMKPELCKGRKGEKNLNDFSCALFLYVELTLNQTASVV